MRQTFSMTPMNGTPIAGASDNGAWITGTV